MSSAVIFQDQWMVHRDICGPLFKVFAAPSEEGRKIRYYLIGTRVLFSRAQIEEFLTSVEEGKKNRKVS